MAPFGWLIPDGQVFIYILQGKDEFYFFFFLAVPQDLSHILEGTAYFF